MKVELFPFQKIALARLRQSVATALGNYRDTHTPQIVSYTAPTGAGKTIIMSALIESIFSGDEYYPDQTNAIFIWLSDSPQLNEQSKLKIDLKADKIRLNQCITITDDFFDCEILEDGHIYFLNTQKLSKSSNLTKHSDSRQYTIWETLTNTVREKSDRLYFIIDEAHRGARSSQDLAKATTIMQKFLKGSPNDKLPPMPVVIGMTATSERFNRLAQDIQSTTHRVITSTEDVRSSGLLKDRIVITYPETPGNDMGVLQAAADEWKDKWDHWTQYCFEQHYAYVNPILIIQVQNATSNQISATDLSECIRIVEDRIGERFSEGQVVHAFGEGVSTLVLNGLPVHYEEPSRIADNKQIKVVFFKETLSTGWDCPRAETMMSFRKAVDYTYIAQLLGRMIRTPMQMHINVDETLNDVHLFLPQFDEQTVTSVVKALQDEEGSTIPADIVSEEIGKNGYDTLVLEPATKTSEPKQTTTGTQDEPLFSGYGNTGNNQTPTQGTAIKPDNTKDGIDGDDSKTPAPITQETPSPKQPVEQDNIVQSDIDRKSVVRAINDSGLLTYNVRKVRITDYLKSLYALMRLLNQTLLDIDFSGKIIMTEIVDMIRSYVAQLKQKGEYDDLRNQVLQLKLNVQIFDVFGKTIEDGEILDIWTSTDADLDRQFRLADIRLGNEGVGNKYINRYFDENDINDLKVDVILFAANQDCMDKLNEYAKNKFHELNDNYRRKTCKLPDVFRNRYNSIVSDGDIISKHNLRLPETIMVPHDINGKKYANHLFVNKENGVAVIKLNGWEQKVLEEETAQKDFVCWLRNQPRASWALCIPYELGGEIKPTYPDFLIIRKEGSEYIVDILEPHDPSRIDNLGKAKGFAEYSRQNPGLGRLQLIRMKRDSLGRERIFRLDMSKSAIRDKVSYCSSNDELNSIFDNYGFFM